MRIFLQHRCCQNVVWILVFRKFFFDFFSQSVRFFVYYPGQPWLRLYNYISTKTGNKTRFYHCTVFIRDICITYNMVHLFKNFSPAEICQARRKEKERNFCIKIKSADFCDNRKRRVVYYDRPFLVVVVFIISARIKRTHYLFRVDAVFLTRPITDSGIYSRRSITIVGSLFELEFFFKLYIRFPFHSYPPFWQNKKLETAQAMHSSDFKPNSK